MPKGKSRPAKEKKKPAKKDKQKKPAKYKASSEW